jgi:hypothetical protein
MNNRTLALGILGFLPLMTGCPSFSTMGLARTLNQGAVQGWVAPEGAGAIPINRPSGVNAGGIGWPNIEGGVRVGVTDRVELGGRLGFNGIMAEGKFGILRPETTDSGFNLSLNPGVGFIGYGAGNGAGGGFVGVLTFSVPILMGIDFGGHEFVIGPRIIDQVLFGSFSSSGGSASSTVNVFYVGGSIGFAIKVSGGFRIMPEIAIGVPAVAAAVDVGSSAFSAIIFQGGVGFLFGSSNQYDPKTPPIPTTAPPPPTVAPAPTQ